MITLTVGPNKQFQSIQHAILSMDNTTTIAVSNDSSFYMQCNKIIHITSNGLNFFGSPTEFANFNREVLK